MTDFFQYDHNVDCFACHDVKRRKFRFGGRGHHMFGYVHNIEESAIVGGYVATIGEGI